MISLMNLFLPSQSGFRWLQLCFLNLFQTFFLRRWNLNFLNMLLKIRNFKENSYRMVLRGKGFFCFFLFDKICPFPSASLAWQGREAGVLRMGNSHRAVKVMLLGEGVSCLYLVLLKLPFTKHGFGRKALSFWGALTVGGL